LIILINKTNIRETGCEVVDGTGSGYCPVVGFGISSVELLGSVIREFSKLVRWILGK
jgi:hypothetical protein